MKHKRQTLSKDETDIKTPKSKSDVGCAEHPAGLEPGCPSCELPPGACPVKDEEDTVKVREVRETTGGNISVFKY